MTKNHRRFQAWRPFAIMPLAFVAGCASIGAQEPPAELSSAETADLIMAWWDGNYDNDAQIAALREDGAPIWQQGQSEEGQNFGGHLPVTAYYRPVDMPVFGDRVIYVEEYTFGDDPYRQRIYTVAQNAETNEVSVKLWYFKDRESYLGAWKGLSKIADLTPDDMSPLPDNCDLYVKQLDDGRLHMKMPKDQCKFGESIFDYQVILASDNYWFRDRIVDAASMQVKMTAGSFTYHKLEKASD